VIEMAKKKNRSVPTPAAKEQPATLKDLLGADVIGKLKEQAASLQQEEDQRKEAARLQKEQERKQKQKELDNNFEHLLNSSNMDWHKFK
jgi:phosphosulfolactate phosphohydrolase-like enzyme